MPAAFAVIYHATIWVVAQAAPNNGKGEVAMLNNKVVGYANERQNFSADNYFWSRLSAVGYNAAGSGGRNKGLNNEGYLQVVKDRIDSFLARNPTVKKEQKPVDMITASGSGLDLQISPQRAIIQIYRVAKARNSAADRIRQLVNN